MEIDNYDMIVIEKNSFVVFDIDETLIYFENITPLWWKKTFDKYYALFNDYDKADELALNEWESFIVSIKPKPIDITGLDKLIKQIKQSDSDMIFITEDKGKLIKELNINKQKVIFIDDLQYNIDDVLLYNPDAKCYLARFIN
jgi:hypothetical protein